MATEGAEVSAWPAQWWWDDELIRKYRARGMRGVAVEAVEVDGVRESGMFLPMRRSPRWQVVVFVLTAAVFLGMAAMSMWQVIIERDWMVALVTVVFAGVGALASGAAYAEVMNTRGVSPGLVITPSRVIRRGNSGQLLAVAWTDVAQVRPYLLRYGKRKRYNMFGIDVRDVEAFRRGAGRGRGGRTLTGCAGPEIVAVSDAVIRMDPLLAYHLVTQCLADPEQRLRVLRSAGVGRAEPERPEVATAGSARAFAE